ncbi:MAG: hypothetical protein ACOCQ0_04065 [Desulfosalsimonas sp.]
MAKTDIKAGIITLSRKCAHFLCQYATFADFGYEKDAIDYLRKYEACKKGHLRLVAKL